MSRRVPGAQPQMGRACSQDQMPPDLTPSGCLRRTIAAAWTITSFGADDNERSASLFSLLLNFCRSLAISSHNTSLRRLSQNLMTDYLRHWNHLHPHPNQVKNCSEK